MIMSEKKMTILVILGYILAVSMAPVLSEWKMIVPVERPWQIT